MNSRPSTSSCSSSSSDDSGSSHSDSSDEDVIEEHVFQETKCLFCDTVHKSPEDCLVHIKVHHNLDIV